MAESISRKQFFRQAFFKSARFSVDLFDAFQPPSPSTHEYGFEADFSPELLAAEAARLGLDPEDKVAVYTAISERMNLQKIENDN